MKACTRPLWVAVLVLWAVGLALETIARAVLLSIRQTASEGWVFSLTLPVLLLAAFYVLALGVAILGLVRRREWSRKLFLLLLTLYYGLLLIGSLPVWGPLVGLALRAPGQGWVTTVLLEAFAGLAFGWWYLNRPPVKHWFRSAPRLDRSEDRVVKDAEDQHGL